MKVLFVCLGNVFRSPVAEAFYNRLTHDHDATSAGVEASAHQLDGRLVVEECMVTIQLMREVGIDISEKRSRQLTPAMVDGADLVVYLADRDHLPDYLAKSEKLRRWPTKDLVDGPDPTRLPPMARHDLWTARCNADGIGPANYRFAVGIRGQIGQRVEELLEEEGRQ
ncbi:MAG: low molecular weight phosphatase family protein [Nitrososphaerota archaeon]|nr:low molecular weight phosphatase family protein [Nitrososphaerota archaeon]MDG7024414.1 low molecular weight phosphatase family protein [Nitrososphaerota archaeon]